MRSSLCSWLRFSWVLSVIGMALADELLLVAHRGASHDAPENTLPAFELAWEEGADAIEGDFHLTRDGHIVCLHDARTGRVSGVDKVVAESDLAELRELDAGSWFGEAWKGTRIPLFKEVAETVPAGKGFYIEIKCGPEIVPKLLAEIDRGKLPKPHLIVISFNEDVIREVERSAPELKTCLLSSFQKGDPLKPTAGEVIEKLEALESDGFSSKADPRVTPRFVEQLREEGFEYHCWTIDDKKAARRFLELGAMSITTNRPAWLRRQLEGN